MSGAPGALPGVPWWVVRVCFGSTPTLRATVIPEPGARRLVRPFTPETTPDGQTSIRARLVRGFTSPAPRIPSCGERPGTRPLPGSAAGETPLGRTRTAAEGLDPGALPMRWGERSMGVVVAGGITLRLSPIKSSSHGQPKAGPGDPSGVAWLSARLGSPGLAFSQPWDDGVRGGEEDDGRR